MSSSIGGRFALWVAPLLFFGCFVAGEDKSNEGDDDDSSTGCQNDEDCRAGRVCIDTDGDLDGLCEGDEECACGFPPGSGGTGNTNGGSGNATGGSATGGSATGGSATGGSATGGTATGGGATGGNGTGGSTGNADCGGYCDRIEAAMCAAIDRPACLSGCDSFSAACSAEAGPLLGCIADPANQVSCMSGSPTIQGCDAEIEAMDRCFACAPETADMECATCTKTSCCDELGDYGLASDVQGFYDCVSACTTNECFDGCVTSYPVAGAAALELVDCQNASCSEPCICEVTTDDDACSTCFKESCCAEYVDYALSTDLEEFETCAVACADDTACIEDCASSSPVAGANYVTFTDCVYGSCATECGVM
jgi:hypothetical protein